MARYCGQALTVYTFLYGVAATIIVMKLGAFFPSIPSDSLPTNPLKYMHDNATGEATLTFVLTFVFAKGILLAIACYFDLRAALLRNDFGYILGGLSIVAIVALLTETGITALNIYLCEILIVVAIVPMVFGTVAFTVSGLSLLALQAVLFCLWTLCHSYATALVRG